MNISQDEARGCLERFLANTAKAGLPLFISAGRIKVPEYLGCRSKIRAQAYFEIDRASIVLDYATDILRNLYICVLADRYGGTAHGFVKSWAGICKPFCGTRGGNKYTWSAGALSDAVVVLMLDGKEEVHRLWEYHEDPCRFVFQHGLKPEMGRMW